MSDFNFPNATNSSEYIKHKASVAMSKGIPVARTRDGRPSAFKTHCAEICSRKGHIQTEHQKKRGICGRCFEYITTTPMYYEQDIPKDQDIMLLLYATDMWLQQNEPKYLKTATTYKEVSTAFYRKAKEYGFKPIHDRKMRPKDF